MKAILFFLLISTQLIFAQYCNIEGRFANEAYFNLNEIDTAENIIYGEAVDYLGVNQELKMDIYYPRTDVDQLSKKPLVILIHGGGFISGDKDYMRNTCVVLAQRGYIAVTISYRLGYPNQLLILEAIYRAQQDAQAALRFLVEHKDDYEIDTNWIFIGGGSAGAITANNVIYTEPSEWESYIPGAVSKLGALNTSGNNLINTYTLKGNFNNWGAVPLNTIDAQEMIPQIAFHGELDDVVEIDTANLLMGSRSIHQELVKNNVCSDLTIQPGGEHGIYTDISGTIFRGSKASCFFKSIMCEECDTQLANEQVAPECATLNSIEDIKTKNTIAYPNPFNTSLSINGLQGDEKIEVTNALGQSVDVQNLNFEGLVNGVYFITISKGDSKQTIRAVKK